MMGKDSIDLSLASIWGAWQKFIKGKKRTSELEYFTYHLENNIHQLHQELTRQTYRHSGYKVFTVTDSKKRTISVAKIRDRVVHRLIYEYLVKTFDRGFDFDVYSCRKNKGLLAAIERTQAITKKLKDHYVWRADIEKFFDCVDHQILAVATRRRITDKKTIWLIEEIVSSYRTASRFERERERGVNCRQGELAYQLAT